MTSASSVSEARDLSRAVAAEIRAQMGRADITRVELAQRLKVDNTWVGKRLNGQTEIGLTDLQRIAQALNVSVVDLLPGSAKEPLPRGGRSTYAYPEDVEILAPEPELVGASAAPAAAPRRLGSPLSSTYPAGRRPPGHPTRHGPSGPRHAARTGR